MNVVSNSLRRHSVSIGVGLALALGVAFYVLVLVPAQRSQVQARYFRVLQRVGENLMTRRHVFEKRSEVMLRQILDGQSVGSGTTSLIRRARVFRKREAAAADSTEPSLPQFEELSFVPLAKVDTVRKIRWSPAAQRLQFAYPLAGVAKGWTRADTVPIIRASASNAEFISSLTRPEVFDHFFVIGRREVPTKDKIPAHWASELYYSNFRGGVLLNDGATPGWGGPRDSTMLQSTRRVQATIEGKVYELFIEPVTMQPGTTWLVCGAVAAERFDSEAQQLPAIGMEVGMLLLVLGVLALPLLRLLLMTARERLHQRDVVWGGLSLVLGLLVIVLLLLSPLARYNIAPRYLDIHLQRLAEEVETATNHEIAAVRHRLFLATKPLVLAPEVNPKIINKEFAFAIPVKALNTFAGGYEAAIRYKCAVREISFERSKGYQAALDYRWLAPWSGEELQLELLSFHPVRSGDQLLWLDKAGEAFHGYHTASQNILFLPKLRERDYFQQWTQDTSISPLSSSPIPRTTLDNSHFRLASVVTYGRSGDKEAVLTVPGVVHSGKKANPVLALYATRLQALDTPVLPPGYSFCVTDSTGEVQFHSDNRLNLSENLLKDIEPAGLLPTALLTHEPVQASIRYQGHRYRMHMQAMKGGTGLFLLTLADEERLQKRQLHTLGLAAGLLLGVALCVLGLLVLVQLNRTRFKRSVAVRDSFPRLWPQLGHLRHYVQVSLGGLGGLGLLFLVSCFTSDLVQLLMLLLLPAGLLLYSGSKLQLPGDELAPVKWWQRIVLTYIGVVNIAAGYTFGWAGMPAGAAGLRERLAALVPTDDFGWLLGFQALLGAGLYVLHWADANRSLTPAVAPAPPAAADLPPAKPSWLQQAGSALLQQGKRLMRHRTVSLHNAYAAMMLTWLLVLSVVPAVYCYQIAYRFEREQQVRRAHLLLFQQNERRVAEHREAQHQYLHFFFYTDTTAIQALGRPPSAADNALYSLLGFLAVDFNSRHHSATLLPATDHGGTDWQQDKPWQGRARLQSRNPQAESGRTPRFLTSQLNDVLLGRHWFWPNDLLRYLCNGEFSKLPDEGIPWLGRMLAAALLLGGLFFVLRLLVRRVFGLDTLGLTGLVRHRAAPPVAPSALLPAASRCFIIGPAADGQAIVEALPGAVCLDCHTLEALPTRDDPAFADALSKLVNDRLTLPTQQPLVLTHFDYRCHDLALTARKLALLEKLRGQVPRLVVVSRVHPRAFGDCGHPRDRCDQVKEHTPIWAAGDRLLDLLTAFEVVYLPVRDTPLALHHKPWEAVAQNPKKLSQENELLQKEKEQFASALKHIEAPLPYPDTARREWFLQLAWLVYTECDSLPFLHKMKEEMLQLLLAVYASSQGLTEDDVVLGITRRAELRYRSLWETLEPAEHYLLYDLAQDGLVNTRDTLVISSLLQKGLLVYDTRLRVLNESFRLFIMTGLPRQQALRLETEAAYEASREGSWQQRSLPLFVVLAVAAGFIVLTQQGAISQTQTMLAALTAALPLLGRLFSGNPLGNDGAGKAK